MLQPLTGLAGLSPMQVQLPPLKGDTSWIDNPTGMEGLPTPIAPVRPSSNSGTITPKAPTPPSKIGDILGGVVSGATGGLISPTSGDAILHPIDTATSFIFTSRLIFLLIGLLLVGAGLFQFRATQTVIETGTKAAKFGAKLAA